MKGKPRHQLLMHPDDLAARGLADGARVEVRSRIGAVRVDVQADDSMMPGVACLPHGFGHGRAGTALAVANNVQGASYNDLSDPLRLDGASGNAALNGVPIEVVAVVGGA